MTPLLEARGLSRRYGERTAVDGISFSVGEGEIFGFLGPNGAGKTTTFEMLSGLRAPDEGELRFRGEPIAATDPAYRARLGVVFQKPSVDDKLTAWENLSLGAALYGLVGRRAAARIDELLALVELGARAHEPVGRFSGGMRRRLELARVLLHEPRLLVLDEPTQGLDPAFFERFWAQVKDLRRAAGLSVLLTTHDPKEAEMCDRLAVLDRGRIVAEGTPEALRERVGGDVIVIEADAAEELVQPIAERFGLEAARTGDRLLLTRTRAHELVPRLVEAFPAARLRSVGLHRPTLADAFVKLTGSDLDQEVKPPEGPAPRVRR